MVVLDHINKEIAKLPESFTSEQIDRMYNNLVSDMETMKGHPNFDTVMCVRHKTLAYSYPSLFYKTIKREIEPHMLRTCLDIKRLLDTGKISEDKAREMVVDGAKKHIETVKTVGSRPNKPKNQHADAHRFQIKCQVDEKAEGLRTV